MQSTRLVSPTFRARFLAAISRLLGPVVRSLIAYGVTYPTVNRMIKQIYVDQVERGFALPFKRLTDSRVSLITGIHRREIARLRRRKGETAELPPVEGTTVTGVLGRWMAGPPYATAEGAPLELVYESSDPAKPSFSRMVRDLGPDVPARSVLDELLRLGVVELSETGHVSLRHEAHIPPSDDAGKLTLLGSDPAEVFLSIIHNLEHPEAPRLQRKVAYDNIGAEALPRLRQEARLLGEEFIRRANALLAAFDRDRNPNAPGGERVRFVLGTYTFEEDPTGGGAAAPGVKSPPGPPGRIRRKP